MSQPGWYPDPAAPNLVRWWDGYRWAEAVQTVGGPGGPGPAWGALDPRADVAEEAKSGHTAAVALWVGGVAVAAQALVFATLFGRFFHALRDQLNAPRRSDGTLAPLVLPHGLLGEYALSQAAGVALLIVQVLFLIWFYKAATIAARAGLPARRSPTWAIVGWIIPVVSLWFPYQSAVDLFPPGHPGRKVVGRWWALYLIQNIFLVVVGIAAFASTPVGVVLAVVEAALALAAVVAARTLITEVNQAHASLLGR